MVLRSAAMFLDVWALLRTLITLLLQILRYHNLLVFLFLFQQIGIRVESLGILLIAIFDLVEQFLPLSVFVEFQQIILFTILHVLLFYSLATEDIFVNFLFVCVSQFSFLSFL